MQRGAGLQRRAVRRSDADAGLCSSIYLVCEARSLLLSGCDNGRTNQTDIVIATAAIMGAAVTAEL